MVSDPVQKLIAKYQAYLETRETAMRTNVDKIHVDEIASKIATFYERVRNVIDFQEDHLIRRETINRILKRRIFLKEFDPRFAEPLIKELIRAAYLVNDSVPETKIADIQKIIDNLIFLRQNSKFKNQTEKDKLSEWLITMATATIEEELFPLEKAWMVADTMLEIINNNLILRNAKLSNDEKRVQLFIAIQKALHRANKDLLEYRLLRFAYPSWGKWNQEELNSVADQLPKIYRWTNEQLKNVYQSHFVRLASRYKIVFFVLGDLIFDGRSIQDKLETEAKEIYEARYKKEAAQLNRLAFLSVISFFLSKILIAFAVEVPLDKLLTNSFSIINTAINIAFPPFLMLVIIALVRMPSKHNFNLVLKEVKNVISGEKREYIITIPKKRSWFSRMFVYLVYLAVFATTLYFMVRSLLYFDFSIASIVIFCLFTSMVIATGVKVYNRSKSISLEKEKASIFKFLLDLISIPFMTIGRWVISGLSHFNILVVIFNLLIEIPFQIFVEFLENFRGFLKTKKDEQS
ncbi:hypothetical protein HY967_02420 [Candidatus Jorgensenbacteria bacterium]|nr:hypothetical protein [Candidatus Jorgensenbacteria bacterium]